MEKKGNLEKKIWKFGEKNWIFGKSEISEEIAKFGNLETIWKGGKIRKFGKKFGNFDKICKWFKNLEKNGNSLEIWIILFFKSQDCA